MEYRLSPLLLSYRDLNTSQTKQVWRWCTKTFCYLLLLLYLYTAGIAAIVASLYTVQLSFKQYNNDQISLTLRRHCTSHRRKWHVLHSTRCFNSPISQFLATPFYRINARSTFISMVHWRWDHNSICGKVKDSNSSIGSRAWSRPILQSYQWWLLLVFHGNCQI